MESKGDKLSEIDLGALESHLLDYDIKETKQGEECVEADETLVIMR